MTAEQVATLADLTREHPGRGLTLRQLKDGRSILAEFGQDAILIKAAPPQDTPEDAA